MITESGSIEVSVKPHWLNGWFLKLFARPFVTVDGTERPASWSAPARIEVTPGDHLVSAFVRYRGTPWSLGEQPATVAVAPGAPTALTASNGWLNSSPFQLTTKSPAR